MTLRPPLRQLCLWHRLICPPQRPPLSQIPMKSVQGARHTNSTGITTPAHTQTYLFVTSMASQSHFMNPSDIFIGLIAVAFTARVAMSLLRSFGWTMTHKDNMFATPQKAQTDPSHDYHYSDSSGFEDNVDSESSYSPFFNCSKQ